MERDRGRGESVVRSWIMQPSSICSIVILAACSDDGDGLGESRPRWYHNIGLGGIAIQAGVEGNVFVCAGCIVWMGQRTVTILDPLIQPIHGPCSQVLLTRLVNSSCLCVLAGSCVRWRPWRSYRTTSVRCFREMASQTNGMSRRQTILVYTDCDYARMGFGSEWWSMTIFPSLSRQGDSPVTPRYELCIQMQMEHDEVFACEITLHWRWNRLSDGSDAWNIRNMCVLLLSDIFRPRAVNCGCCCLKSRLQSYVAATNS